jgi:dTDP-glucose 4,6-dehydratase
MVPREPTRSYRSLISFVEDRPGHDWRYAIDPSKAEMALAWRPKESLTGGLEKTVAWYLENQDWSRLVGRGTGAVRRGRPEPMDP